MELCITHDEMLRTLPLVAAFRICNMLHISGIEDLGFFIVKYMQFRHVFGRRPPFMSPSMPSKFTRFAAGVIFVLCAVGHAQAGTATAVNGLAYTGVNPLRNGTDSHWTVSYSTEGSAYQGAAYVVGTPANGWTNNVGSADWITAPGNGGSAYLPGNGTTGVNAATYVYKLAFEIAGKTGDVAGSVVTNQVSITLTLAADDQAKVYVNPTILGTGAIDAANSKLGGTLTSAWANTTPLVLQNYDNGAHADNATFVIGTNYLYIQVDNTNGIVGQSNSTATNLSGLLVYQTGSSATIIGTKPVPEVGIWLPIISALGLVGFIRFRAVAKTAPAASS
jgi:hypothetical protein